MENNEDDKLWEVLLAAAGTTPEELAKSVQRDAFDGIPIEDYWRVEMIGLFCRLQKRTWQAIPLRAERAFVAIRHAEKDEALLLRLRRAFRQGIWDLTLRLNRKDHVPLPCYVDLATGEILDRDAFRLSGGRNAKPTERHADILSLAHDIKAVHADGIYEDLRRITVAVPKCDDEECQTEEARPFWLRNDRLTALFTAEQRQPIIPEDGNFDG